jgi:hypothetical protein
VLKLKIDRRFPSPTNRFSNGFITLEIADNIAITVINTCEILSSVNDGRVLITGTGGNVDISGATFRPSRIIFGDISSTSSLGSLLTLRDVAITADTNVIITAVVSSNAIMTSTSHKLQFNNTILSLAPIIVFSPNNMTNITLISLPLSSVRLGLDTSVSTWFIGERSVVNATGTSMTVGDITIAGTLQTKYLAVTSSLTLLPGGKLIVESSINTTRSSTMITTTSADIAPQVSISIQGTVPQRLTIIGSVAWSVSGTFYNGLTLRGPAPVSIVTPGIDQYTSVSSSDTSSIEVQGVSSLIFDRSATNTRGVSYPSNTASCYWKVTNDVPTIVLRTAVVITTICVIPPSSSVSLSFTNITMSGTCYAPAILCRTIKGGCPIIITPSSYINSATGSLGSYIDNGRPLLIGDGTKVMGIWNMINTSILIGNNVDMDGDQWTLTSSIVNASDTFYSINRMNRITMTNYIDDTNIIVLDQPIGGLPYRKVTADTNFIGASTERKNYIRVMTASQDRAVSLNWWVTGMSQLQLGPAHLTAGSLSLAPPSTTISSNWYHILIPQDTTTRITNGSLSCSSYTRMRIDGTLVIGANATFNWFCNTLVAAGSRLLVSNGIMATYSSQAPTITINSGELAGRFTGFGTFVLTGQTSIPAGSSLILSFGISIDQTSGSFRLPAGNASISTDGDMSFSSNYQPYCHPDNDGSLFFWLLFSMLFFVS